MHQQDKFSTKPIDTISQGSRRLNKYEKVLGMGMEYPEFVQIARNQCTSMGTPLVELDSKFEKGKSKSLSNIMTSLTLPKLPKMGRPKKELPPLSIIHISHLASQERLRRALASSNQEAAIEAWTPGVFRRYDMHAMAWAETTKPLTSAQASQIALSLRKPSNESLPGPSSLRSGQLSTQSGSSSQCNEMYTVTGTQSFTRSVTSFFSTSTNPPGQNQVYGHASSEPARSVSSFSVSYIRRHNSGPLPYSLAGNPQDDHDYWFGQITENDISFPRHTELEDINNDGTTAIFIRPGWLEVGMSQEDLYRKSRDEEILRISEYAVYEPANRRRWDSRTKSKQGAAICPEEVRPQSRWSDDSDSPPGNSWQLLWGARKKRSFESNSANAGRKHPFAQNNKEKKFTLVAGDLFRRAKSRKKSAESGESRNSNESMIPHIDPLTYHEPHPGNLVSHAIKDVYQRMGSTRSRRGEKKKEELKGQTRLDPMDTDLWL